jgi:mono/diheme cytochrome c family protein
MSSLNATPRSIGHWLIHKFCAGGADEISRRSHHQLISSEPPALKNPLAGLLARARPGLFTALLFAAFLTSCRQDMQDQPKYKPLAASRFFSDGKSARQLVEGTEPFQPGGQAISPTADESKATALPFALTPQALDRGQGRFNIYCSPCHGRLGYGDGMVVQRGFLAPPSYHIDRLRQAPVGHFYDVMTNGFGAMPSYADKVAPQDRWAVAAYIRALQLSQHATINDAPPEDRGKLQSGGQKQ